MQRDRHSAQYDASEQSRPDHAEFFHEFPPQKLAMLLRKQRPSFDLSHFGGLVRLSQAAMQRQKSPAQRDLEVLGRQHGRSLVSGQKDRGASHFLANSC